MTAASAENIARTPGRFDAIGAAGIAQVQAGNAQLGVTSSETDKLVQTNKGWNSFAGQLGLGYVFYARHAQRYSQKIQWFPSTEPELNAYYLGLNDIKGDVWRFNNANFNQLNYKTPINSTRLMFDEAVTIVSKKWLSLYAIGGVGAAWNHVGYSDSDKGLSCPDQRLVLNSNTSSNFSWEAGGGLSFLLGKRVSLTLEYLYTDLGTGQTSSSTAILVASENSCSTSTPLASGASCNILVRLNALQLLPFNRTLQIGIDSRQVQLDAPAITTTVGSTCTTPTPTPTPAPTPAPIPAPTPTPPGLLAEPLIFGAAGVTGGGASPYTSVAGDVDGYPVTTTSITDFPPATLTGTINAADTGGGTVAAAAAAAATALLATETTQGLACLAAG
ncbi:MAG: hypothetical protein NTU49_08425, partial [Gammaproteobacteria bacterium]|nr:hypothetical protein [Gammaproteobacteria bacterium]